MVTLIDKQVLVCVDAGNEKSGYVVFTDNTIGASGVYENEKLIERIFWLQEQEPARLDVVIEDLAAYTQRLTPEVIDTAKFIGELSYRLKMAHIEYRLIPRSAIKEWVFKAYPDVAVPLINKKIEKKGKKNKDGSWPKPSFVYVDNTIVVAAMRKQFNLPPTAGKRNRLGITSHAWQALALGWYWKQEGIRIDWNKMINSPNE